MPHASAVIGARREPFQGAVRLVGMVVAVRTRRGGFKALERSAVAQLSDTRLLFAGLADGELDRLYRLAGLILGNGDEAEDAVGDALARGWEAADTLRSSADFAAWLDRILVNICRDRLRRRGRIRFIALGPEHEHVASPDPFRALAQRDDLTRAVDRLPPDERLVIVLHFWADLTLEATSVRLGWPIGTVKSRIHRALVKVRAEIATMGESG